MQSTAGTPGTRERAHTQRASPFMSLYHVGVSSYW